MKFQRDSYSCGVVALMNAFRCFGEKVPEKQVRAHAATTEEHGTQEHGLKNALERLGWSWEELGEGKEGPAWSKLIESVEGGFPVVLLFDRWQHWATAIGAIGDRIIVFDSTRTMKNKEEHGVHVYTRKQLLRRWHPYEGKHYGIIVKKGK